MDQPTVKITAAEVDLSVIAPCLDVCERTLVNNGSLEKTKAEIREW